MGNYLIFFVFAYLFAWMLISLFQYLGTRYQIFAEYDKEYPYRKRKVPLLGGAPLYFGFILTLLLFFMWQPESPEIEISLGKNQLLALSIGAAFVSLIGLIRDIHPISFAIRISIQILAGFLLVMAQIRTDIFFLNKGIITIGQFPIDVGNTIVTVFWVVLLINLLDFLERFEGLVTGIGIVAGMFLYTIAIWGQNYGMALLCLIFSGTLVGILWEQLPPVKISLGKMGTGFIGFILAALTLGIDYSAEHTPAICIPIFLLAVPLGVGAVLLARKVAGKQIAERQIWLDIRKRNIKANNLLALGLALSALNGFASLLIYSAASATLSWIIIGIAGACGIAAVLKFTQYEFTA